MIKTFIKKLFRQQWKIDPEEFYNSYTQLSHDLKNNLVAIRASIENIRRCLPRDDIEKIETVNKTLLSIEKKINHSFVLLNMTGTALHSIQNQQVNDASPLSITNCFQEAMNSYPFSSDKYASSIKLTNPTSDFLFLGNKQLLEYILHCLIQNALQSIYALGYNHDAMIELKDHQLFFNYTYYAKANSRNLFMLGTPESPGAGLTFIKNTITSMKGNVLFKRQTDDRLTIILTFQVLNENPVQDRNYF